MLCLILQHAEHLPRGRPILRVRHCAALLEIFERAPLSVRLPIISFHLTDNHAYHHTE